LDKVVARSVQNEAGPQAAGLQAQPCQNEAKNDPESINGSAATVMPRLAGIPPPLREALRSPATAEAARLSSFRLY
jgi:hypothetical protein